jgi:hypothetical protein
MHASLHIKVLALIPCTDVNSMISAALMIFG